MSRARWLAILGVAIVTVVGLVLFGPVVAGRPSLVPAPSTEAPSTEAPSTPSTTPRPPPTERPIATGDSRLLYAEFLLRLEADRTAVATLNHTLQAAAEAGDRPAVRQVAIDILDFTDTEHDWLREHPPAACYADAHEAADSMLEAYAATADAFISWADAGEGLDGLAAFGRALEAVGGAGDAVTALGRELEATTCRS